MKINVGEFELVYSSTIIQIKDYPITIVLPDEIEGDFKFIIDFMTDEKDKTTVTKFNSIDKFTIKIDFINFRSSMGAGNSDLFELGTLKHLPLFINYRVFDLPNAGHTLMINFYVGKETING